MTSCKIFDDNIKQFLPPRRPREKIPLINSTNDIPGNKKTSLLKCAIKNKLQKKPDSKSFDSGEMNILRSKYSQKQLEFHMNNRLSNLPRTISSEDESITELEKITNGIPTSNILGMMKFKQQYLNSRKSSDSEIMDVTNDVSKLPFIAKKESYNLLKTKNKKSSNFLSNDYLNISSTEGELLEVLKVANDSKRGKSNFRCNNKYLKKSQSAHSNQHNNHTSKSRQLVERTDGHQNALKKIAPLSSSNCSSITQKGLKSEQRDDFINVPTIDMVSRRKPDKCIPCLLKSAKPTSTTTQVKKSSPSTILSDDSDDSTILPFLQAYKQNHTIKNTKPPDRSFEDIQVDLKKSDGKTKNHHEMFLEDETLPPSQSKKATVSNQQSFDFVTDVNKPSSDSSHHSEIGEDDGDDNFFELKILAPCHEPIVLEPSMEPLYALMNKKFTTMEDRIKSQMVQQSQDINSSDEEDGLKPSRQSSPAVQEKNAEKSTDVGDKKKLFTRTQTLASFLPGKNEDNPKKLRRSTTVFELPKTEGDEEDLETEESSKLSQEKIFTKEELILQDLERAVDEGRVVTLDDILRLITAGFGDNCSDISQLHHVVHQYLQYINGKDQGFGLATKALNLLIESKSCLSNCSKRFAINKDNLKKIIPKNTYNEIAPILNLPKWSSDEDETNLDDQSLGELVRISKTDGINDKYSDALKLNWSNKMRLVGFEEDNTLKTKADEIINKICTEFCQWLRDVSEKENNIDEEVLKDLFRIDLSAGAQKSMQDLLKKSTSVKKPSTPKACKKLLASVTSKETFGTKKSSTFEKDLPEGLHLLTSKRPLKSDTTENVSENVNFVGNLCYNLQDVHSYKEFLKWVHEPDEDVQKKQLREMINKRSRSKKEIETIEPLSKDTRSGNSDDVTKGQNFF